MSVWNADGVANMFGLHWLSTEQHATNNNVE